MRGDHGKAAAIRRKAQAVTATVEDYKRKVARLEAENRDLRQRLEQRDRAAHAVERKLRAERDEGVAPKVEAYSIANQKLREERDRALRECVRLLTTNQKFYLLHIRHLREEHPDVDAQEAVALIMGRGFAPDPEESRRAFGINQPLSVPRP